MLTLNGLLNGAGIGVDRSVKLYRHVNHKHPAWKHYPVAGREGLIDVEAIYAAGKMAEFQASQSKNILGKDVVLFFIGEDEGASRFIGGYEISHLYISPSKSTSIQAQKALRWDFYLGNFWWDLQEIEQLKYLVDRLVVKWPTGRGFHRFLPKAFEVMQVKSKGSFSAFPGFSRLLLSFDQMAKVVSIEGDHSWREALKSTRGVYLISNKVTGDLYVGSATSEDGGFLGRWQNYAKSGHGGNKIIKLGIEAGTIKSFDFQICVLETLTNLATRIDGLDAEKMWKQKLGRKAVTLNGN